MQHDAVSGMRRGKLLKVEMCRRKMQERSEGYEVSVESKGGIEDAMDGSFVSFYVIAGGCSYMDLPSLKSPRLQLVKRTDD